MSQKVESVLVVGAGTMGAGIGQVAATAGCKVSLFDAIEGVAEAARQRIEGSLGRAQAKGYVTAEDVARPLANLCPADSLDAACDADVVIEAVKEDLDVKQSVFGKLEELVGPEVGLWTNTSMISISRIAAPLKHPQRVVGTHFFNPAPRMKLVEIIAGEQTAEAQVARAESTLRDWGKTTVRAPDTPGFIVNRIFDAIKREALQLLEDGTPADQIDTAVKLGLNFPMGPFEVMDLVGLQTTYACLQQQAEAMDRPADFGSHLPKLVEQGKYGRKTGEGFYRYNDK